MRSKTLALAFTAVFIFSLIVPASANHISGSGTADIPPLTANETRSNTQKSIIDVLQENGDVSRPLREIILQDQEFELHENESVTYSAEAPEEGLYALSVKYRALSVRDASPAVSVEINGEIPYAEAAAVELTRRWDNAEPIPKEGSKTPLIPEQVQVDEWRTAYLADHVYYYGGILVFPLKQGINSVKINMLAEGLAIADLRFKNEGAPPAYKESAEKLSAKPYSGESLVFEAEDAVRKSDASLFAVNDRSTPAVSPSSAQLKYLNTIGGSAWSSAGQYIEWEFTVPEKALYNLTFKYIQKFNIGMSSGRKISIDGNIIYDELNSVDFPYASSYKNLSLGGGRTVSVRA